MEKRIIQEATELRAVKSGSGKRLAGYAARYNVRSGDLGGFREKIAPGAFERILSTNLDCVALVNHDPSQVLGRTTNGTLKLRSDAKGLGFSVDLPDTSYANDLHQLQVIS